MSYFSDDEDSSSEFPSDEELIFESEPTEEDLNKSSSPAVVSDSSLEREKLIRQSLQDIQERITRLLQFMGGENVHSSPFTPLAPSTSYAPCSSDIDETGCRVIEGVFNGEEMVGSDGNVYPVPANYASKSRLVEGDILKLRVKQDGSFVYKQIGPIERERRVGRLAQDASNGYYVVLCGEDTFKVLTACVTYFHGKPGDETVILTPKGNPSIWAAVESILSS